MYAGRRAVEADIEEYQAKARRFRELSEELEQLARSISETEVEELSEKLRIITGQQENILSELRSTAELMNSIVERWRGFL